MHQSPALHNKHLMMSRCGTPSPMSFSLLSLQSGRSSGKLLESRDEGVPFLYGLWYCFGDAEDYTTEQAAFRSQYHEAFQKTQEHMANLFPPVDVDEWDSQV